MRTTALVLLLALPFSVAAKDQFQSAKFVGAERAQDGSTCDVDGTTDKHGNISGTADCQPRFVIRYKVAFNGSIYTLQKTLDHPGRAVFTMGYSALMEDHGVLSVVTSTAADVKIKIAKNGDTMQVKIGKRESRYRIVPGTVRQ